MRVRLFLSFLLLILLSLVGVALFVRQSAQDEVQAFLGRGGLVGAESLVEELEAFYASAGSWEGAGRSCRGMTATAAGLDQRVPVRGHASSPLCAWRMPMGISFMIPWIPMLSVRWRRTSRTAFP